MGEEKRLVPVWEKELLSVKEAAAYFGIGERVFHGVFHGDEELHGLFPVHQAVVVGVAVGISMPSLSEALQKAKGRLLPMGWYHL